MPRYLFTGSYTLEGGRGLLAEGGSRRREVREQLAASVGGTVESFRFAFGGDDFFIITDLPDHAAPARWRSRSPRRAPSTCGRSCS